MKRAHPDKLIAMQIGDFFEFAGWDAVLAVEALGLKGMGLRATLLIVCVELDCFAACSWHASDLWWQLLSSLLCTATTAAQCQISERRYGLWACVSLRQASCAAQHRASRISCKLRVRLQVEWTSR